jgi:Holliday junction resolvase-like predicted endonuclease
VRRHYESLGYQLAARRLKTPFSEIDLVMRTPANQGSHELVWIEVKSLTKNHWSGHRVSSRQLQRLRRAFQWAIHRKMKVAAFHLAFVRANGQIEVLERFLS